MGCLLIVLQSTIIQEITLIPGFFSSKKPGINGCLYDKDKVTLTIYKEK